VKLKNLKKRIIEENLKLKQQLRALEKQISSLEAIVDQKMEEKQMLLNKSVIDKSKDESQVRTLHNTIEVLQRELSDLRQEKQQNHTKTSSLLEDIKKLKESLNDTENANETLKQEMITVDLRHTQQLKKLIETHLQQTKESGDVKTLKVTIELLQEQIQNLKQGLAEEPTNQKLEHQLKHEFKLKEELLETIQLLKIQHQTSANLVEFYKTQFEEWKQVYNDQKHHWKQEFDFMNEKSAKLIHQLEMENDQLLQQKNKVTQDYIGQKVTQLQRSWNLPVRSDNRTPLDFSSKIGSTMMMSSFDTFKRNQQKNLHYNIVIDN